MELKPGRKQTEVGVIPENWVVRTLDSCVQPSAPICYGILMPGPHVEGGVLVIKVRDIEGGRVHETDLQRTHPAIDAAYKRSRVRAGDLLLTIRGSTGRVAATSENLNDANITQDTARIRIRSEVDARFVYHALQADAAQQQIALRTIGQAVKGLNIRDAKMIKLALPLAFAEQRAIAEALSDTDALLDGLDRLIAKKRDLKQAAMQQLLTGKTRLPGFTGEWGLERLGDIAVLSKGTQLLSSEASDSGQYPHLNGGISASNYTDKTNTPAGTIAISEGGNSCGYVQFVTEAFWCGGHCYAVSPRALDSRFLYYALKCRQANIMALRVGSGLPNVQKSALGDFCLLISKDTAEQRSIGAVLSDMDAELEALEARRNKVQSLKHAMMQELLTGKTRLVAPEGAHA
jgi:type I restriction enzyme S subunit